MTNVFELIKYIIKTWFNTGDTMVNYEETITSDNNIIKEKSKHIKLSDDGIGLLTHLESVESDLYFDSAGLPTIGVGHLLSEFEYTNNVVFVNDETISYKNGLSYDEIIYLLEQDLERFEEVVNNLVKVDLTRNQYDALVIFAFNIGANAFKNSTLLKELNKSNFEEIPNQLMRWVYVKHEKSLGLKNRRTAEVNLWVDSKYTI